MRVLARLAVAIGTVAISTSLMPTPANASDGVAASVTVDPETTVEVEGEAVPVADLVPQGCSLWAPITPYRTSNNAVRSFVNIPSCVHPLLDRSLHVDRERWYGWQRWVSDFVSGGSNPSYYLEAVRTCRGEGTYTYRGIVEVPGFEAVHHGTNRFSC